MRRSFLILALAAALLSGCTRGSTQGTVNPFAANAGTCIACHVGITNPHDRFALRCTDCHGGDATVPIAPTFTALLLANDPTIRTAPEFQATLRAAHVIPVPAFRNHFYQSGVDWNADGVIGEIGEGAHLKGANKVTDPAGDNAGDQIDSEFNEDLNYVRFLNPGDLRVAQASCGRGSPMAAFVGQCHDAEVDSVRRTMMATLAGVQDGAYYGNRALPGDPNPPPASNGDPRGGRFGYVLDYASVDAQFTPAQNRFTGDDQAHAGKVDGFSPVTLEHGKGQPARFPWGGKPLKFPDRGLLELNSTLDRPLLDGGEIGKTAAAIAGTGAFPGGFAGENPVDSVLLGFRPYNTTIVPPPERNFAFAAFPDVPPNPFGRGFASGCTACHMLYDKDGHNHEPQDPTVSQNGRQVPTSIADGVADKLDDLGSKYYPSTHKLTTRIPTLQCGLCHGFVTRIDQSFEGRIELAGGLENDRTILPVKFTAPNGQQVEVFSNLAGVSGTAVFNEGEGAGPVGAPASGAAVLLPDRINRSESFDGRQLRLVYGGAQGTTHLQDIHVEVGMHCIDCHFIQDVHGDGNIYARNWDVIEIECDDCHGTAGALSDFQTSGPNGGNDLRQALDEDGNPFFAILSNGDRIQRSRVTPGLFWRIPQVLEAVTPGGPHFNARAQAAMGQTAAAGGNAHIAERGQGGKLECYACHNSWTPNCFSCHYNVNFDSSKALVGGVNGERGQYIDNIARQGFTDFALFSYTRSPFILGVGGTVEGQKLATFRSTMEAHVSASGPVKFGAAVDPNATILDNVTFTTGVPSPTADVVSGVAMNMYMPHTVRKSETRDCESCHTLVDAQGRELNNHILAGTLGQGTGRYQNLGDWLIVATAAGVRQVNFKAEAPGQKHNVWPGFVLSDAGPQRVAQPSANDAQDVALIRNFTPKGAAPRAVEVAFVAEGAANLVRAIDTTNRDTPNRAALAAVTTATAGPANAVKGISPDLSDSRLFVACGIAGVQTVDASGYFSGTLAISAPPANWDGSDAQDLDPRGQFLYVAAGAAGLRVVQVGPPLSLVGGAPLAGGGDVAKKVAVMGTFAFVAAGTGGLEVFDVTTPSAPSRTAVLALAGDAQGIALEGSRALVAAGIAGVHVVDITRPRAPALLRTIKSINGGTDAIGDAHDVVIGSVPLKIFAAISDQANARVLVVNLTDPFDFRERLADHAAEDPNYKYSLERRDPLTPRDPANVDVVDAGTGDVPRVLVFPLGAAPRRIAPGAALDRLADESGRRLRESWQEGAGVISADQAARMRAVIVEEVPGGKDTDPDDLSGNGIGPLFKH